MRNILGIFYLASLVLFPSAAHCGTAEWFRTLGLPCPENGTVLLGDDGDLSRLEMEKDGGEVTWEERDGVLTVGKGDVVTRKDYGDMRLHVEFKLPKTNKNWKNDGNSGLYIQQRYEVQILNSHGRELRMVDCGALYRQRTPDVNACLPVGEWQTFDILFHQPRWNKDGEKIKNARISVMLNGVMIHNDVEIPNKTGVGKQEGPEKRPLRLQHHGNPVQFRNIWIVDLEEATE